VWSRMGKGEGDQNYSEQRSWQEIDRPKNRGFLIRQNGTIRSTRKEVRGKSRPLKLTAAEKAGASLIIEPMPGVKSGGG